VGANSKDLIDMTMKCPKCGEEVSLYDGDIEVWSIGEKEITVRHISMKCQAGWKYRRNA